MRWALIRTLLLCGPRDAAQLTEDIWGDDPEGGPIMPRNEIDVLVCQARKHLALLGLRIERARYGQDVPWRIVLDDTAVTAGSRESMKEAAQ